MKTIVPLDACALLSRSNARRYLGGIGEEAFVPMIYYVVRRLEAILSEPDTTPGGTIVVTRTGTPYTRPGFSRVWDRLKVSLATEGFVRPGLTFHGLRKSLGRDAAELGFSENDIAGALGQTSPASARPYTAEAQQRSAAERVMRALERRGRR